MKTAKVGKLDAGSVRGQPVAIVPFERYKPKRKAEFFLNGAIDEADYQRARRTVRKMGIDPDAISHRRPE